MPAASSASSAALRCPALRALLRACLGVALALGCLLGSPARAQEAPVLPLARFVLPNGAPDTLEPLLQRVLESLRTTNVVDPDLEERQLRRLRNAATDVLATEGFFGASVAVEEDSENKARYVLRVDLGPRARVGSVEIDFAGPINGQPDRIADLRKGWELPVGQPFRDSQWSSAKSRLLARVQDKDFPAAALTNSEARVDVESAAVALRVTVDSGPAFTLGDLQVTGLQRYEPQLVERFNDFKVGERYDGTKLLDMQRRLQAGPYFASVLVDVPIDREHPDNVPIRIEVKEAPSKRVTLGAGFSTDVGPRLEGTYRQVGLFGYPYTLQSGLGLDAKRQIGYADVLLPPRRNGARDSVGVLGEHTDIQGLITTRAATGVARDYNWVADSVIFDTRLSLNLQRETERADSQPESEKDVRDTLVLAYNWTRRAVDSITDPRHGNVLATKVAGGIGRAGVVQLLDKSFGYLYGRYVQYVPVLARDLIILRGEAGYVVADDLTFVPTDYRFRAGGSGSVRGYDYQSLGVIERSDTGDETVVPARALGVASAEYVHWFNPTWGAAVFFDVGDAFNDLAQARWARGYGLGGRYRTVAGPLALDVAYGERDNQWRVHFAVAISF